MKNQFWGEFILTTFAIMNHYSQRMYNNHAYSYTKNTFFDNQSKTYSENTFTKWCIQKNFPHPLPHLPAFPIIYISLAISKNLIWERWTRSQCYATWSSKGVPMPKPGDRLRPPFPPPKRSPASTLLPHSLATSDFIHHRYLPRPWVQWICLLLVHPPLPSRVWDVRHCIQQQWRRTKKPSTQLGVKRCTPREKSPKLSQKNSCIPKTGPLHVMCHLLAGKSDLGLLVTSKTSLDNPRTLKRWTKNGTNTHNILSGMDAENVWALATPELG